MADIVQSVEYYYTVVADRPGEGVKVLSALSASGVNLVAYTGFPTSGGSAQLDLVPSSKDALLAAAEAKGIALVGPKVAFLIQGEDRVGAVAGLLAKLAEAGINVTAMEATSSGQGRYGAILWVKPDDTDRAAALLEAS